MAKVIVKQLKDLKGNPQNPRKISKEQLENLKKSLDAFGDLSGFVFNRRTNQLIGAHQRAEVSPKDSQVYIDRKFDEPTKTGTVAEGWIEIDGERHKYREVDIDEQREKAMNIAANKHGGEFDMPKLTEWLLELDSHNVDLSVVGFTAEELEDIMAPTYGNEGLTDADAVPEVPKEAKTKRGELWTLGQHRVLCGDATDKADVDRLMAGEKADITFTSPPYNLGRPFSNRSGIGGKKTLYGDKADDDLGADEYLSLLNLATSVAVANSCYAFINVQQLSKNRVALVEWIYGFRERLVETCVWVKTNPPPNFHECQTNSGFEYVFCLTATENGSRKISTATFGKGQLSNVFTSGVNSGNEFAKDHGATFPVGFAEHFVVNFSTRSALDLFLGSGSTLIACEKTGRKCFGMEIEPLYIDVILDRWAKFTGKDPVREDGVKWSELRQAA